MKLLSLWVILFILASFLFVFKTQVYAVDVVINEFMPNPSSGSQEWVEFYNSTDATIDLSDYYFDDDTSFESDSGSSSKISLSGLLPALQTCFWELSSYLNNNGDVPSLFKMGSSTPLDTYNYSSSSAGLSYTRVPDGGNWMILQQPTKSSNNCIDLAPTSTPVPTSAPTPTKTPTPAPTDVPTSTPRPSPSPTVRSTPTDQLRAGSPTTEEFSPTSILEKEATVSVISEPIRKPSGAENGKVLGAKQSNFPKILIGLGVIFLIACGILVFRTYKNKNSLEKIDL